jgi:pimeloyl-ACP methyl ester carboxylesterase
LAQFLMSVMEGLPMARKCKSSSCTRRAAVAATLASTASWTAPAMVQALAGSDFDDHLVVRHRRVAVNDIEIFYREAGHPEAPAVLLLHGFPTSSHMFRHLIPALAGRYRVIAPDYPGFGFSAFPVTTQLAHTFAAYADIIEDFVEAVGLARFMLYIQDYGAPIGLRLALKRPERIAGIIAQNGNAYEEGLSEGWGPLKKYWRDPTPENRKALMGWLGPDGLKLQYLAGLPAESIERIAPENWLIDQHFMQGEERLNLHLDLFADYKANVELYPAFQAYFRKHQPPMLIVWGQHDPFFTIAGARAYLRDLPRAQLHLLDASHFVLETQAPVAIALIKEYLAKTIS